jgi:hypothetical protein
MKKIVILMIMTALCCSCSKNATPEPGPHIGKWKLMTGSSLQNGGIHEYPPAMLFTDDIDFSKENIIFEFKDNGSVTISDNLLNYVDPDWVALYGWESVESLEKGTHAFSTSLDDQSNNNDEVKIRQPARLSINNASFRVYFKNSSTKMELRFYMSLHFDKID